MAEVFLARLDDAPAAHLDERTWADNLDALGARQADLAARLAGQPAKPPWRAVASLDGFVTFRAEAPGQPPQWLGGTAAPLTRAEALLSAFQPGQGNPVLPAIGAGAELLLLLRRLGGHRAVYVFEEDPTAVAAVLRAVRLADQIRSGRCLLVPPARQEEWLSELLASHPGLLPPGNILQLPHLSPARIERVRRICERLAGQISRRRARELDRLAGAGRAPGAVTRRTTGLAVLALRPQRGSLAAGQSLAGAAERLGWQVARCQMDGPLSVHPLVHARVLHGLDAAVTICVNHCRALAPVPLRGQVCEWYLAAEEVPAQLSDDGTWRLAAAPAVAEALRAAGAGASVLDFYWACDPELLAEPLCGTARPAVVLVGDLPDLRPESCGIEQASQRQLWGQLAAAARRGWETAAISVPEALLAEAEKKAGLRLLARTVRDRMLGLIERVLIPGVMLERILRTLEGERVEVLVAGRGWRSQTSERVRLLTEEPAGGSGAGVLPGGFRPLAAVFAGSRDPLTPSLLRAAARGWPLLLHAPGGQPLAPRLGGVLQPGKHFLSFAGAPQLRAALAAVRDQPQATARRVAQTRDHLRAAHTYVGRLQALARRIGLGSPAGQDLG